MVEIIKSILERVTRYEWFTILLPGIFLVLIGNAFEMPMTEVPGGWRTFFIVVFWGYVSYATGETVVEWAVKKFCPFAPYTEYIEWSEVDKGNANMLVSNLNMFRSLIGMVLILVMVWAMETLLFLAEDITSCKKFGNKRLIALMIYLGVVFVWSYVKQIEFIKGRIKKFLADKSKCTSGHKAP